MFIRCLLVEHYFFDRIFRVVLKTMSDLNNNMLDIHKKAKDTTSQKVQVNQTNNSVFVGSTKDLQNLLNKDLFNTYLHST